MKKFFIAEENPYHPGTYFIACTKNFYDMVGPVNGCYHVFQARIFGQTFATYLRMLRDKYNATITGIKHKYPLAQFKRIEDITEVINELNIRMNKLAG